MELVKIIRGPGIGSPQSLAPSVPGAGLGVILQEGWSPLTVFSGEVTVQATLEVIDRFFRPSPELQGLGWGVPRR